jgi:hypothetical protein
MNPTEACTLLTSDEVMCANQAAQATGSVLCGIKADGLKVQGDPSPSAVPFPVTIVLDGGLSQLENIKNGVGLPGDAANTDQSTPGSLVSFLKGCLTVLHAIESSLTTLLTGVANIVISTAQTATNTANTATNTSNISGKLGTLGQKSMAGSAPVVIASDQSSIPAKDDGPNWTTLRGIDLTTGAPFNGDATAGIPCSLAPAVGQKFVLTDLVVSPQMSGQFEFYEEVNNRLVYILQLQANTVTSVCTRGKIKLTTADHRLCVKASVPGTVTVQTLGYSEA